MNYIEKFTNFIRNDSGKTLVVGTAIAGIAYLSKLFLDGCKPKTTVGTVKVMSWTTISRIDKKTRSKKDGWTVPAGASVYDTRWEFKGMSKVPSGVDQDGNTTYKEVPKYATKYYYEVDEWAYDRSHKAHMDIHEGENFIAPYYPEVELQENEKITNRSLNCSITIVSDETGELKTITVGRGVFDALTPGSRVAVTKGPFTATKVELV